MATNYECEILYGHGKTHPWTTLSLQKFRTFDASSLSKNEGEVLQGREGTKYLTKASA